MTVNDWKLVDGSYRSSPVTGFFEVLSPSLLDLLMEGSEYDFVVALVLCELLFLFDDILVSLHILVNDVVGAPPREWIIEL